MKQLFLQTVLLQHTHYGHKWKVIRIGVQQETNKKNNKKTMEEVRKCSE